MYLEQIRQAVQVCQRGRLAEIQAALWKSWSAGAVTDDEATEMSNLIEARRVIPASAGPARRYVGSRPRSPASLERRRSWSASGWLPPAVASGFTLGEIAALSIVALEVALRGRCELAVGAIAGRSGVCATVVRNALRQARDLGLVTVEERRLTYCRNLPNVVRIVSTEWSAWIAFRGRRLRPGGRVQISVAHEVRIDFSLAKTRHAGWKDGKSAGANRKVQANAGWFGGRVRGM